MSLEEYLHPKETEDTIYLSGGLEGYPYDELLEFAQTKWPDIKPNQIQVSAEYHQIRCFGHDLHDPEDYQNFVVLTRIN